MRNRGRTRFVTLAGLGALAGATVIVFAGVLRNGWILLDDPDYVLTNSHVRGGLTLDGLRWLLRSPHAANYHPLTTLVHMLNVQCFGLNSSGHHAVSLALHAANAVLLALALSRLTGAWWKSLLVAALFALHPLRVESVAWASELKDVLSSLFFMLTLLAYIDWAERPNARRYVTVALCLAAGLLAKPMLVTLPFVLVLLDYWPLGRLRGYPRVVAAGASELGAPARSLGGLLLEKWPLFLLIAASAVGTFVVQRGGGAVIDTVTMPLPARAANAALSYGRYLRLTLWPQGLVPYYPLIRTPDASRGAFAAVALLAATALVAWQARRRPYLAMGWFWYLGTLVPVIGLVQVGMQSHADRYTYLPVIGIAIAGVWWLGELVPASRAARVAAMAAACALIGALGAATVRQVSYWHDNRTIFTRALALDHDNVVAYQCLGSELQKAGQAKAAIPYFEAALRVMPAFSEARTDLGVALGMLGRYNEAILQFHEVLRSKDNAGVRHDLGVALMHSGRGSEAIAEFEEALRFDPEHFETLVDLGSVLGSAGRAHEAVAPLRRAVELRPDANDARRQLAVALSLDGSVEEAIENYRTLAQRDSTDLDALNNIAWIRATHPDASHRNGAEAVRLAELARDRSVEPMAVLFSTLAAAYAEAGRMPEAVREGQRAVRLAGAERDSSGELRYARQLALYRAGVPFHFAR